MSMMSLKVLTLYLSASLCFLTQSLTQCPKPFFDITDQTQRDLMWQELETDTNIWYTEHTKCCSYTSFNILSQINVCFFNTVTADCWRQSPGETAISALVPSESLCLLELWEQQLNTVRGLHSSWSCFHPGSRVQARGPNLTMDYEKNNKTTTMSP